MKINKLLVQHYLCYLRWCFSDPPLLHPCRPSQSPQYAHNSPVRGEKYSLAVGGEKKKNYKMQLLTQKIVGVLVAGEVPIQLQSAAMYP